MPTCEICKSGVRSYTHALQSGHRKKLMKIMAEKKRIAIEKFGGYWFYM